MEDFSKHFCNGIEEWKPICFECKYPKEKREEMLLKEVMDYQKKVISDKGRIRNLTGIIKRIISERDFYKKALATAIKDIKWSKRNTRSKISLVGKLKKVIDDDAKHEKAEVIDEK